MPRVPTRSRAVALGAAVPFVPIPRSRTQADDPRRPAHGRDAAHGWGRSSATLDVAPPRWVRERFGLRCCRETIRMALHRLELSWKKAKKLLGRADSERRQAF